MTYDFWNGWRLVERWAEWHRDAGEIPPSVAAAALVSEMEANPYGRGILEAPLGAEDHAA